MNRTTEHPRLAAVASAYLVRDEPGPRVIAVAGETSPQLGPSTFAASLMDAARQLSIEARWIEPDAEGPSGAGVSLLDLGVASEDSLPNEPPRLPGCDLLLWTMPQRPNPSLRSTYLLGVWTWLLDPVTVRCVFPAGEDPAPWRRWITQALTTAGHERPSELLAYHEDSGRLLAQRIVQSVVARRSVPGREPTRETARSATA